MLSGSLKCLPLGGNLEGTRAWQTAEKLTVNGGILNKFKVSYILNVFVLTFLFPVGFEGHHAFQPGWW